MLNNSDFTNNIFGDVFKDYIDTYQQTGRCRDDRMLNIALHKKELEDCLNEMWHIYSTGNVKQIVEYNKQIDQIKNSGYSVMRNSAGNHRVVLKKE